MVQWTEVDPSEFDNYPTAKPAKARDAIDDVLDGVAEGKTVLITLDEGTGIRGRRMSIGRRAKKRGFSVEMRYQENRIIVRKKGDGVDEASEAPSNTEPEVDSRGETTTGSKRKRT